MTKEFHISKKWRKKGKILRAVIHGAIGNNYFFTAEDKIHNNGDRYESHERIQDNQKDSSSEVFCKAGLLPSLVRVPSRGLNGLRKLGRAVSMRKHNEEEESVELCKKRIIMGKKCRPLNVSGALHYDKNGVLVPEDFVSSI